MRYPKNHKDSVRQQLLQEAARHANKHGFAASGVDALAGAAGLTSGSLYKHFDSKSALFSALIAAELEKTVRRFRDIRPGDNVAMLKALSGYLSMSHVLAPEAGCPATSLAADVARSNGEVRQAFEAGLLDFKNVLKDFTGSDNTAWTLLAQNVGAVVIARAMFNESVQRELISAVRDSVAELVTKPPIP